MEREGEEYKYKDGWIHSRGIRADPPSATCEDTLYRARLRGATTALTRGLISDSTAQRNKVTDTPNCCIICYKKICVYTGYNLGYHISRFEFRKVRVLKLGQWTIRRRLGIRVATTLKTALTETTVLTVRCPLRYPSIAINPIKCLETRSRQERTTLIERRCYDCSLTLIKCARSEFDGQ